MRFFAARFAFIVWAGVVAFGVGAQQVQRPLPPLMRTLSDEVGVLSVAEGRRLSRDLEGILEEDGIRIVLVIAETVQPGSIEDYAERLSQRWAKDRGIDPTRAIFIILAVEDRELVVMPGRALGLESELRAPEITDGLPPLFRQERYYDALMMLTERVHKVVHKHGAGAAPKR